MAIALRSFRNTDTSAICHVWNEHHAHHPACKITPLQFELAVLAKPYFDADQLLVAEVDEEVRGFVHYFASDTAGGPRTAERLSILSALCVVPSDDEAAYAEILLDESERRQIECGALGGITKPIPPDSPFYLGLGFGDSMTGITTRDQRAYGWLVKAGYQPKAATSGWELNMEAFQAPVDRLQIQIRRAAHVDRLLEEPQLPWWHACILGHTEPTGFQLTLRSEGRVAQYLLVWSVSHELASTPESIVWMWPIEVTKNQQSTDQLIFLIAEALRQLAEERVETVRTVSNSANTLVASTLSRLGFRNSNSGVVLEKQFIA